MESTGSHRRGLLGPAGILSIVAGALEVIGGGILVGLIVVTLMQGGALAPLLTGSPSAYAVPIMIPIVVPDWAVVVAAALLGLGITAIVGGVSALRRRSFGLSLAGAVCALPLVPFGILAVVFTSVSKREFGTSA